MGIIYSTFTATSISKDWFFLSSTAKQSIASFSLSPCQQAQSPRTINVYLVSELDARALSWNNGSQRNSILPPFGGNVVPTTLRCGHIFCESDLQRIGRVGEGRRCPTCRKPFRSGSWIRVYLAESQPLPSVHHAPLASVSRDAASSYSSEEEGEEGEEDDPDESVHDVPPFYSSEEGLSSHEFYSNSTYATPSCARKFSFHVPYFLSSRVILVIILAALLYTDVRARWDLPQKQFSRR
ncbi:hypothetical protein BD410DRAFT_802637 [Rickenella mellea]|uniref:RING-type domain-containing protein n=1 Tax=Rickenella mellea TaxID=50990 RepID=A0A4Y7Q951_9AGAM|nr:hypothetical protein BD410DRAFT_802637 [Rickenella mellea]